MNKMQQSTPQSMNSAPSTPLSLISTEQIQKYLEENRNLIMAILEYQNMGKMAECAQYQAILQKNLMYLAAIADAQPPGSATSSQLPAGSVTPQGNSHMLQTQASTMHQQQQQQQQQQQAGGPIAKLPFQLNSLRPQEQQSQQLLHFQQQQQMQAHFGLGGGGNNNNNGFHLLMQPGGPQGNNSGSFMDFRGTQQGTLEASSGDGQGSSGLGQVESRE